MNSARRLVRNLAPISPSKRAKALAYSCLESLESRTFLSGTVLASVVHGNLVVRGDTAANIVVLDQTGLSAGQIRITGTDATSINGQTDPVILTGFTARLQIKMGGGADNVTLNNLTVTSSLAIQTNSTASTTLINTTVGKNLSIRANSGDQTLALQAVTVQGNASINTGNGADHLTVDDSTFHGRMNLNTGSGNDLLQVEAHGDPLGVTTSFGGPASISMGSGNDTLQLGIDGQPGNHAVFSGINYFGGGRGQDTITDFDSTTYIGKARVRIRNFEITAPSADTTAPVVTSNDPATGITGVALNKKLTAVFSEAMDPATLNNTTVVLTDSNNAAVLGTIGYVGTSLTFSPTLPLTANAAYTLTITTGAKDLAGNALAATFVSAFTTGTTSDATAPTVVSTNPATNAAGVALNKKIAVTFSEPMDPLTLNQANFTVTVSGGTPVLGTIAYLGTTATFTPTNPLASNTVYVATITTGAKDLAGNALANDFVWTFTTGATADTTAPVVSSVDPGNIATGVPLNKKVAAVFSEAMDPLTVTAANVSVTGPGSTPVLGTVAYVGTTMTFTPTSSLTPNTLYTLTITTGVKDLAGNAMAANFVSTFTTGATADVTAPTVVSTSPTNLQTNVFINKTVAATFSESIDPLTIPGNFVVTGPGLTAVAGSLNYDAPSMIATFTPSSNFAPNTTYTATITGGPNGVKDLAGNALLADKVWTFTTGTQAAQAPINLGSAGTFAVMATSSIVSNGPNQINGDVALNPGTAQGIPAGQVNGTIHVDDQAAQTAQSDLLHAYNDATSRTFTSAVLPGNMGGLIFTPGLYTNSSSVLIQGVGAGNDVTLDAQGDPNAVFIFKMGTTLTTGTNTHVILMGGAKASNIFWQVGTSATLFGGTSFNGTILAGISITVNNGSVVNGRLLGGSTTDGSVTINASTVNVPV